MSPFLTTQPSGVWPCMHAYSWPTSWDTRDGFIVAVAAAAAAAASRYMSRERDFRVSVQAAVPPSGHGEGERST